MNDPQLVHLPSDYGALSNKWTKMLDRRRRSFKNETHWAMFCFIWCGILFIFEQLAEEPQPNYRALGWLFFLGFMNWIVSWGKDQSNPWKTISPNMDPHSIEAVRSQLVNEKQIQGPIWHMFIIGISWFFIWEKEVALTNWYVLFSWSGLGKYLLGALGVHLVVRYFHFNAIRADLKLVDEVEKVAL